MNMKKHIRNPSQSKLEFIKKRLRTDVHQEQRDIEQWTSEKENEKHKNKLQMVFHAKSPTQFLVEKTSFIILNIAYGLCSEMNSIRKDTMIKQAFWNKYSAPNPSWGVWQLCWNNNEVKFTIKKPCALLLRHFCQIIFDAVDGWWKELETRWRK